MGGQNRDKPTGNFWPTPEQLYERALAKMGLSVRVLQGHIMACSWLDTTVCRRSIYNETSSPIHPRPHLAHLAQLLDHCRPTSQTLESAPRPRSCPEDVASYQVHRLVDAARSAHDGTPASPFRITLRSAAWHGVNARLHAIASLSCVRLRPRRRHAHDATYATSRPQPFHQRQRPPRPLWPRRPRPRICWPRRRRSLEAIPPTRPERPSTDATRPTDRGETSA